MKSALILALAAGQERKEKPTLLNQKTLLDIVVNGTSIRLHRESPGTFDGGSTTRYVVIVRRKRGKDWIAVQKIWPEDQLNYALLEVNLVSQKEIQRLSVMHVA